MVGGCLFRHRCNRCRPWSWQLSDQALPCQHNRTLLPVGADFCDNIGHCILGRCDDTGADDWRRDGDERGDNYYIALGKEEADEGKYEKASCRLHNLATHLLSQGERSMAATVLLEAENLQHKQEFSEEGRKNLKYGTRALLLSSVKGNVS